MKLESNMFRRVMCDYPKSGSIFRAKLHRRLFLSLLLISCLYFVSCYILLSSQTAAIKEVFRKQEAQRSWKKSKQFTFIDTSEITEKCENCANNVTLRITPHLIESAKLRIYFNGVNIHDISANNTGNYFKMVYAMESEPHSGYVYFWA